MALIFFAVLFVLGISGMDQKRGIRFAAITGALLFVWTLFIILDQATSGGLSIVTELGVSLIGFLALALLSFFLGHWMRVFVLRLASRKGI